MRHILAFIFLSLLSSCGSTSHGNIILKNTNKAQMHQLIHDHITTKSNAREILGDPLDVDYHNGMEEEKWIYEYSSSNLYKKVILIFNKRGILKKSLVTYGNSRPHFNPIPHNESFADPEAEKKDKPTPVKFNNFTPDNHHINASHQSKPEEPEEVDRMVSHHVKNSNDARKMLGSPTREKYDPVSGLFEWIYPLGALSASLPLASFFTNPANLATKGMSLFFDKNGLLQKKIIAPGNPMANLPTSIAPSPQTISQEINPHDKLSPVETDNSMLETQEKEQPVKTANTNNSSEKPQDLYAKDNNVRGNNIVDHDKTPFTQLFKEQITTKDEAKEIFGKPNHIKSDPNTKEERWLYDTSSVSKHLEKYASLANSLCNPNGPNDKFFKVTLTFNKNGSLHHYLVDNIPDKKNGDLINQVFKNNLFSKDIIHSLLGKPDKIEQNKETNQEKWIYNGTPLSNFINKYIPLKNSFLCKINNIVQQKITLTFDNNGVLQRKSTFGIPLHSFENIIDNLIKNNLMNKESIKKALGEPLEINHNKKTGQTEWIYSGFSLIKIFNMKEDFNADLKSPSSKKEKESGQNLELFFDNNGFLRKNILPDQILMNINILNKLSE